MPTSHCPPFPADLPIANIPKISFLDLVQGTNNEPALLYDACTEHGFFLLDLRGTEEGDALLKDAEKMFDLSSKTFDLGSEKLNEYAFQPPSLLGYKPSGILKTDDGKRDTVEMYTISRDSILGLIPPSNHPPPITASRQDGSSFFHHAHAALRVLFSHLDTSLALAPGTLHALCPLDKPSLTSLRLLSSRPEVPVGQVGEVIERVTLPGHTDIGTITMLFHIVGGLQILPAGAENEEENWRYVRPEPGCALVNLGDTVVEWTGGVLRSSLHRVVSAPGKQGGITRRSLAYLVRPHHDATMRRLKSGGVVPMPGKGDEEMEILADEWAALRVKQIIRGEVKPQGRGGRLHRIDNAVEV